MTNNVNPFEYAIRNKLRFVTNTGSTLTMEDLYDLPLTSRTGKSNLDDMAKTAYGKLQSPQNISFVNPQESTNVRDQMTFDIIKMVIDEKVAANALALAAKERAEKRQKLLELIDEAENKEMAAKPVAELREMLAQLS